MSTIAAFLTHTPAWVYVLFAYLLWRGVQARRERSGPPWKFAIVPALFMLWGLWGLRTLYGFSPDAVVLWLVGLAVGAGVGWLLVRGSTIAADRSQGVLHLSPDRTLLPLLMATFAVRYAFGAVGSISPDLLQLATFRVADLLLSGVLTGIFVGKFALYMRVYQAASLAKLRLN